MAAAGINTKAPVRAEHEIEINAEPERVWELISDIERWPTWDPDVQEVVLLGPLAPGAKFRVKASKATITSKVIAVEPPSSIAWKGAMFGVTAVRRWSIEPRAGGTLARSEESWTGWPARLMRRRMQKMLDDAMGAAPQALKAAAENGRERTP